MSTDPVPVPEAAVDAAKKAYAEAESAPNLVHCERCKGTGYHHGFGENGHDPDWCLDCGGGGVDLAPGEEDRPLRAALAAALPHLGWRELDTLDPKDCETVLFWDPMLGCIYGVWFEADEEDDEPSGWEFRDFGGDYLEGCEPTHWQPKPGRPAPPPPSSKEDRT